MTKMKKTKDKILVFRHYRHLMCKKDSFSEKEMKEKLVETELNRGYVPKNITFKKIKRYLVDSIEKVEYDMVWCASAFAGKKQARVLYEEHPEIQTIVVK